MTLLSTNAKSFVKVWRYKYNVKFETLHKKMRIIFETMLKTFFFFSFGTAASSHFPVCSLSLTGNFFLNYANLLIRKDDITWVSENILYNKWR